MKVMTAAEIEEKYGLEASELDTLARDAADGILHGEPRGDVVVGRPMKFGEEMRQVGFKEPLRKIDAIDRRAESLGLSRSDYIRSLIDRDLASIA